MQEELDRAAQREEERKQMLVTEGEPAPQSTPATTPKPAPPPSHAAAAAPRSLELQSYEISPYKSGSDDDEDDRPRKPVPGWARSDALASVLYAQAKADPDAIFVNPVRTCCLSDVFETTTNRKGRDFTRRGSSGDWSGDALTRAEEIAFRKRQGFLLDGAAR